MTALLYLYNASIYALGSSGSTPHLQASGVQKSSKAIEVQFFKMPHRWSCWTSVEIAPVACCPIQQHKLANHGRFHRNLELRRPVLSSVGKFSRLRNESSAIPRDAFGVEMWPPPAPSLQRNYDHEQIHATPEPLPHTIQNARSVPVSPIPRIQPSIQAYSLLRFKLATPFHSTRSAF
jgi:hypothetical protein